MSRLSCGLRLALVWTGFLTITACSQRKYIGGSCAEGAAVQIIDDMETGDYHFSGYEFSGYWTCYYDESAATNFPYPCRDHRNAEFPAQPILDDDGNPSERSGSKYARHLWSSDRLVGWGASFGFNLNDTLLFDASSWTGLRFYARSRAGLEQPLRVHIPDWHTSTQGNCKREASAGCDRNFGSIISLTSDWQEFSFRWADLEQPNFPGDLFPAILPDKILGVRFQIDAVAGTGGPYDFWIDDVAFLCER